MGGGGCRRGSTGDSGEGEGESFLCTFRREGSPGGSVGKRKRDRCERQVSKAQASR